MQLFLFFFWRGTILGLSVPSASVYFFFGALLSLLFREGTILVLSVPLASVPFFFDALIYSLLFWGGPQYLYRDETLIRLDILYWVE